LFESGLVFMVKQQMQQFAQRIKAIKPMCAYFYFRRASNKFMCALSSEEHGF